MKNVQSSSPTTSVTHCPSPISNPVFQDVTVHQTALWLRQEHSTTMTTMNVPAEPASLLDAIATMSVETPKERLTYALTRSTLGREAVTKAAPPQVIAALLILDQHTIPIIINAMGASAFTQVV